MFMYLNLFLYWQNFTIQQVATLLIIPHIDTIRSKIQLIPVYHTVKEGTTLNKICYCADKIKMMEQIQHCVHQSEVEGQSTF